MAAQIKSIITDQERRDLDVALLRNCTCSRDAYGVLVGICPGHDARDTDPRWIARLCFIRTIAVQLQVEELSYGKPRNGETA